MDIIMVVYDRKKKEYVVCDSLDKNARRFVFSGEMRLYQVMQYFQNADELKGDDYAPVRKLI